jgi:predicted lipoprotein with Yx(FWY)xxD motif
VVKGNHQQDAKLISDGAGGAIIVWQDSVSGSYDIFAQRLDNTGAQVWAGTGVAVCNAVLMQINPRIEIDGAGGGIVVWQDRRNGLDYDIYAQRINGSGLAQWATNGIGICVAAGTQSNPKIEPDGAGGAYIGWQDKRNGTNYDIYANRINASGSSQWFTNGSTVCAEPGNQSALDMASEGVNGVMFTWKDDRNGNSDIYFQRADSNGSMQYSVGGNSLFLLPNDQINPNITGDGNGGAIIAFQDSSTGTWNIISQRVNAAGSLVWTLAGISVGTAADNQTSVKSVSDGKGGCIYAFQDKRNTGDFDIYAHRVYADGTSSSILEPGSLVESVLFPNPFMGQAVLKINSVLPLNHAELHVFDMTGSRVAIEAVPTGTGFLIRSGDLSPGIYFYEIRMEKAAVAKGKLILLQNEM